MKRGRWRTNTPWVQQAARILRQDMTPAESALWQMLRREQIDGHHFRRQHAVDRFILDFYCPQRKLCIELDGGVHDGQQERDAQRTAALATRGIRVLRFRNEEVLGNLPAVIERIRQELQSAPEV